MLDMGFGVQIDKILKYMPKQRQTLMFSATLPPYIIKMSNQYMNEPVRVSAGEVSKPVIKIEQEMIKINNSDKYEKLTEELAKRSGSVIVFVKSKHGADKLAYRLSKDDHEADAIHGDLRQNKRDKVIKSFREGKYRILVATDIAARGLDIPHIEHVINFDLPQAADDYIHRIGRTGRNGAEGKALNFVSGEDGAKWKAIQRLLNPGEKGQYEGDGRPQERGSSGGGRGKPSGGRSFGGGNGNSSPYAKKRPFGSRADGSDRGNRFDAPRQDRNNDRSDFRSDRPERSDRPARADGQRFDNRFDNRGDRGERSGNKFAAPRFEARPERDGNREGANRSRFEAPKSEGGYKNRNKDFGDFRNERPAAPRGEANGNREGGNRSRFEAPRSEGRSNAPRFEGRRAEGGRSEPAGRSGGYRPEAGRSEGGRFEGGRADRPRSNNGGGNSNQGNRSSAPRAGGGDKPRYSSRSRAA
ncbi:MAG: DEAD/DEAH box helicase [Micavibrio aeruginosavorus]|uniref:DEAD/DEAH box helicase n=1 Tax=Micavibrio aeruginosavorus TaxID=349221 RepID=A0A2W5FDV2_9BACT|nr:MAG: DEAD/DEAH box helicase [Micavibrio aeruginosavorus]